MTQLIILGNGFDLQCGLKSSYKNFFDSCILDNIGKRFQLQQMNISPKQTFGFWEKLLFEHYKKYGSVNYNWCDIETIIKETLLLVNFGKSDATSPNPSEGLWGGASTCHEGNNDPDDEAQRENDTIKRYLFTYCAHFFYDSLPRRSRKSDNEKRHLLNTHLLQELKKIERRFCKYIKENIVHPENEKNRNDKYLINAVNLIAKLTRFSENSFESIEDIIDQKKVEECVQITQDMSSLNILTNEFAKLRGIHILSFNYTALFDILAVESPCVYSNVHGKLCQQKCNDNCISSSAIFGIDDTIIQSQNSNDDLRIFSKTYRKMLNSIIPISILPQNDGKPLTIKFYGHSLSGADYSYFQSIFDYYNLYDNSKVDLIFYYSKGYEQTDAIYRLINIYGKTLSNQDQGKNLMHKLLLENRIKIIEMSL